MINVIKILIIVSLIVLYISDKVGRLSSHHSIKTNYECEDDCSSPELLDYDDLSDYDINIVSVFELIGLIFLILLTLSLG